MRCLDDMGLAPVATLFSELFFLGEAEPVFGAERLMEGVFTGPPFPDVLCRGGDTLCVSCPAVAVKTASGRILGVAFAARGLLVVWTVACGLFTKPRAGRTWSLESDPRQRASLSHWLLG